MKSIISYSEGSASDDFRVTVDVESVYADFISSDASDEEKRSKLSSIEEREKIVNERIASLDADIDRLTSKADGLDYSIAAAAGVICGAIDSFFVGAFDYNGALEKIKTSNASAKVNGFVESKAEEIRLKDTIEEGVKRKLDKARQQGKTLSSEEIQDLREKIAEGVKRKYLKFKDRDATEGTTKALSRAISFLEKKFPLPLDKIYEGVKGTSAGVHHADDPAHHPTPLGLIAAIIGTCFRVGFLTVDKDNDGNRIKGMRISPQFKPFESKKDVTEWLKVILPIVISGVITWLLIWAKKKEADIVNSKFPKPVQRLILLLAQTPAAISILGIINTWLGHLVSDVAGSHSTAAKGKPGKGLPGFFLASLKELSCLPGLQHTQLPKVIDEMYSKDGLDLRGELAIQGDIWKYLGKQTVPVIGGEIIVRTFYFVRHLVSEIKAMGSVENVDWHKVLPFNNRTVARMVTVESSVFTAFDLSDAAIRSTLKTGGPENPLFWKELIFTVNFVGIGRCVIAVGNDVHMGVDKHFLVMERLAYKNQALQLQNAKVFVYQEGMWKSAKDASVSLICLYSTVQEAASFYSRTLDRMNKKWVSAVEVLQGLRDNNKDSFQEAFELL